MTQNEYEKLGKQKRDISSENEKVTTQRNQKYNKRLLEVNEDDDNLQPITIKMVQGAFYLLAVGYSISGEFFSRNRSDD